MVCGIVLHTGSFKISPLSSGLINDNFREDPKEQIIMFWTLVIFSNGPVEEGPGIYPTHVRSSGLRRESKHGKCLLGGVPLWVRFRYSPPVKLVYEVKNEYSLFIQNLESSLNFPTLSKNVPDGSGAKIN